MNQINGRIFLWGPICIFLLYLGYTEVFIELSSKSKKEILKGIVLLYGILNITGLYFMFNEYKGNNNDRTNHYWDLDHWFGIDDKEELERVSGLRASYSYENKFCYCRMLSILCWLSYFILLVDRWFKNRLTIRL